MLNKTLIAACCGVLVLVNSACAEPAADRKQIYASIERLLPGVTPDYVGPSPVSGLYEVVFGAQLFYVTPDGKYMVQGDVIDMTSRKNISTPRRDHLRAAAVDAVGEENMIVFAPDKVEHTVTVFTDIDCGYCRKLHKEIDKFEDRGIKVRYVFFPRTGPNTPSFQKAVNVWCADDRNQALTDAKAGKNLPQKECANPVQEHYDLGRMVGVNGTPAIVLEDGRMVPGYVSPTRLAQVLDGRVASVR